MIFRRYIDRIKKEATEQGYLKGVMKRLEEDAFNRGYKQGHRMGRIDMHNAHVIKTDWKFPSEDPQSWEEIGGWKFPTMSGEADEMFKTPIPQVYLECFEDEDV